MIPANMRHVKVTYHATERLVQRARLFLTETERRNPDCLIRDEFRKSYVDMSIELCPFKKNVLTVKNGPGAFISMTKDLSSMESMTSTPISSSSSRAYISRTASSDRRYNKVSKELDEVQTVGQNRYIN